VRPKKQTPEPNSIALKTEAAHSSETSQQAYYPTYCKNPED